MPSATIKPSDLQIDAAANLPLSKAGHVEPALDKLALVIPTPYEAENIGGLLGRFAPCSIP